MGNCLDDKPSIAEKNLNLDDCSITCGNKDDVKDEEIIGMENNLDKHGEGGVNKKIIVGVSHDDYRDMTNVTGEQFERDTIENNDEKNGIIMERENTNILDYDQDEENFEDAIRSNKENIQEVCENKELLNSKTFKKKSKNKIKEERLKIHSETHRLMREREISIPYHLPKPRTLKEFLSRKKNRANIPLNAPPSKMLEIWKDIEESTKNAFEFFKSDSDSDSEACKKVKKFQKLKSKKHKMRNGNNSSNSDKAVEDGVSCGHEEQENLRDNNNEVVFLFNGEKDSVPLLESNNTQSINIEEEGGRGEKDSNLVTMNNQENNNVYGTTFKLSDIVSDEQSNSAKNVQSSEELNTDPSQTVNESTTVDKYSSIRTSEWVNNIPVYEKLLKPNRKEILLKKLNPKLLKITPKLSGDTDSVIDLENVKNDMEIGAKNLRKRFLENCLPPKEKTEHEVELTVTMSENNEKGEICKVTTEKLIYNSTEGFDSLRCEKPGAKLQRLREELKKKIEEKWEEEYKKKVTELELESANKEKKVEEDDEDLLEDMEDSDETENSDEESEEEEDEDDDDVEDVVEKPKLMTKKNDFIDSEAEESECEDEESGNEGGDELDDGDDKDEDDNGDDITADESGKIGLDSVNGYQSQSSQIPPYQPGGGMLNGGSELSQCDDNSFPKNIFSPTLKLSLDLSPVKKNMNIASQQTWDLDLELPEIINYKNSFVPRFPENDNFDLNDAYEFCSGKFPDNAEEMVGEMIGSQDSLKTGNKEYGSNSGTITAEKTTPLENDCCSESEVVNGDKKKMRSRVKVVSDDSEGEILSRGNNLTDSEYITKHISEDFESCSEKGLIVHNKKIRKHLQFSDEEGNSESEQEKSDSDVEDEPEEERSFEESEVEPFEEDANREIEYNSEEEEIINPREFFEKEAELSGSEWSGDEDERDLDKMEEEDGDADKLDEKRIRSQLEKIHMRTLLDDDAREVRILQELLFEDGDLFDDGPKREKNFRWKNLGTFFDDDGNGDDVAKSQDQDEIEEDEQSTKIRHEKELFLLHLKSKREELGTEEDDDEKMSFLKVGKVVIEKSMRGSVVCEEKITKSSNVNKKDVKTPCVITNKRGSFLSRNEEFLSRLAKFTSSATDNILGPKHSKNFVFATKSPEKVNPSTKENSCPKRKGVLPKDENQKHKKTKLDSEITHSKVSILDRLV